MDRERVQLGLIGDNITRSQAPRLHECAGDLIGVDVCYDRLVPGDQGRSFEEVFAQAQASGYRGLNITYPYKERVVPLLTVADSRIARLGAVNTVLFTAEGPLGYNTDFSGFIAGYKHVRGAEPAGRVCMVGAGGVGKAVAFGLLELGLQELRLVERDLPKAEMLAAALRSAEPGLAVKVTSDLSKATAEADGLVNCTPVGMVGYEGTPVPRGLMTGASWAFDAVYTPPDTQFLHEAEAAGLAIISGEELFFYQGLHAFSVFHGREIDEAALRDIVAKPVA